MEDIIISLNRNNSQIKTIDTTISDRAYKWEIPFDIESASNYSITITSFNDSTLFSISNLFSIIDTVSTNVLIEDEVPTKYNLSQNYPNPFNPTTSIKYSIPTFSHVQIIVYDAVGNKISTLVDEQKSAGIYKINFDGNKLSSGIYIYQLNSGSQKLSKKMILLK